MVRRPLSKVDHAKAALVASVTLGPIESHGVEY